MSLYETRKPLMFMVWELSDVSMTRKTNYFNVWRHQDTPNKSSKSPTHCCNFFWGKPKTCQQILEVRLINSWSNIFRKTWNWIFEILRNWNFETLELGNLGTSKLFSNERNPPQHPTTYRLPPLHQHPSWGTRVVGGPVHYECMLVSFVAWLRDPCIVASVM